VSAGVPDVAFHGFFTRKAVGGLSRVGRRAYVFPMAITLWLSADEENLLERIMRAEGYRNKQEALIRMLRDRAGRLTEGSREDDTAT
jgi:hypothetical protein